ncbi:MAG TPA: hypothetical protein VGV59_12190 [Pyrinomonadaceae bacterium]|nr:hypothetical protein [Pyrinomonadaceae bacterium]
MKSGAMATLCVGLHIGSLSQVFAQDKTSLPYTPIPHEATTERNFYFTKNTFDKHIDSVFRVQLGRKVTELKLIKVQDCTAGAGQTTRATSSSADSQCFLLVFSSAEPLSPLQTIFPMEHGALGSFSIFLVETEDERGRLYYTATYNHTQP